jgi:snurportin-1
MDAGGIQAAYSGEVPFQRDGLLLLNKEAHYTLGHTPLALLWKDAQCSRYVLDTNAAGHVPQWQQVVLRHLQGGQCGTEDDPPVHLATLSAHVTQKLGASLRWDAAVK